MPSRLKVALVVAPFVAGLIVATPAFATTPTLSSFTPTSGPLGTSVTITGSHFAAPATVKFDGVAATSVTVSSSTKITAKVPATGKTGKISVTSSGGTATSSGIFTVTPGVALSTTSGPPTTSTTVSASGFGAREALDVYLDATELVLVPANSSGQLSRSVVVPASATPGTHYLTVVGRHSGSSAQAAFTVRTDWAAYGFDASGTGSNPYENLLSPANAGKLHQQWRISVAGSPNSTPAISGGVVYATFNDGTLRAYTASTGAQLWSFPTSGSSSFAAPTVSAGTVYFGSSDDRLYAVDAATGKERWHFTTGDVVYSAARVSGNLVYFGSYDKKVYALSATTGALVWSFTTGAAVYATPVVVKGVLYDSSFDGILYALNATTGSLLWSYTVTGTLLASPVVADGLVYAAGSAKVAALDASSGEERWSDTVTSVVESTPTLQDGVLFVGDDSGTVTAYDAGDGVTRWTHSVGGGFAIHAPLASANGIVYASSLCTYALRASDGVRLRSLPAASHYGGAIVADGTVIVGDYETNSSLVRYDLPASARP